MKFKCPCGSSHYQIFRTTNVWHGTYVSDDHFPDSVVNFDQEDREKKWTVQCEFCNKTWGPKNSLKRMVAMLKRIGVLR